MPELDLRLLQSFLAVAEEGGITRASARLHLAQQAVSAQMRQLEHTLGVALLVRTSRGVLLTAAGRELATGGPAALEHVDRLVERVRGVARGESGKLRLACKPHATAEFALEVTEAIEARVPGVDIELTTASTLPEELTLLATGAVDAAFLWAPIGDPRLPYAPVRSDRRMVALAADHPLAGRRQVQLADLADEPVIRPAGPVAANVLAHWLAEPRPGGRLAKRGPAADRSEDHLLLVARGRGVWLAPEPISRYFPSPRVRWLPVTDAEPSTLVAVWTPESPSALVSRLIAEVRALTGWHDS
ncbi:LysR family transcriptional regulator [Pseudonocardia sp. DSM 110487]|uniref:LysR family transcriptional regulator n=1 Tax=Pseudonocardia sp. DSM 110487 TaxID=2865833 RepID=UPI001C69F6D4|nr:LysR family transcriptional regulator [Pseudonocardia sp. DSM 110487]QYN32226.1 LysR family transcriptional regulator [Pseudonocardia sp. DSM 110487]